MVVAVVMYCRWNVLGPVCYSAHRGKDRRGRELPVAVGHGIVGLLLLQELSNGQQLLQHVLQHKNIHTHIQDYSKK